MKKINITIKDFNLENINMAEIYRIFNAYKTAGVIKHGSFDDEQWKLTDEYENCTFRFDIQPDDYQDYESNLGIKLDIFVEYLKIYILCKLGEVNLSAFRQFLHDIKEVIKLPFDDLAYELEEVDNGSLPRILDFFKSLPSSNHEEEFRYLYENISKNISVNTNNSRRVLATFDSYFIFGDIIRSFWKEATDIDEKLFFFPVWFWWRLSSVFPMRPREVVLTPRSCLNKVNDQWQLTVRKDNKKGSNKKKTYKIDTDYSLFTFVITDDFASDISWYIDNTKDYGNNDLNTLFITDTHYKRWERCKPYNSRYFTYVNLNTCLRYFFEFIIKEHYGFTLIEDLNKKHLATNEIQRFNLGDTRHLSLIGIIFSGAPASIAQVLAGHDSMEIGAHYYSNISSFVETQTYRSYKKLTTTERFELSEYRKPIEDNYVRVPGGKCFSKKYAKEDFSDCLNVLGPEGEIGYCSSCFYFRTDGRIFKNSKKEYEEKLASSYDALRLTTAAVRNSKGYVEDITKKIFEINTIANEYSRYLMETRGEQTWEDQQ